MQALSLPTHRKNRTPTDQITKKLGGGEYYPSMMTGSSYHSQIHPAIVAGCLEKGVSLKVLDQNIDTSTSEGKLMFHMLGALLHESPGNLNLISGSRSIQVAEHESGDPSTSILLRMLHAIRVSFSCESFRLACSFPPKICLYRAKAFSACDCW